MPTVDRSGSYTVHTPDGTFRVDWRATPEGVKYRTTPIPPTRWRH